MRIRTVLGQSLLIYIVLFSILAICQLNFLNADFIAYVTVAHRAIAQPSQAITAYWSPLFSWAMIPMLIAGVDDLIAGRLVLLISGAVYLCAIHRLVERICSSNSSTDRLIKIGTMACSTIQASIWSTYLLDPDLLANALVYIYFCIVVDDQARPHRRMPMFLAGVVAGACYLAKAYMLPFCLLHFCLTIVIRRYCGANPSASHRFFGPPFRTICLFSLGLGIVAGPWIACLSLHEGHPTFSTAGSSNHANVSPESFKKDPLWNPGLVVDYIFEPSLKPDWSPIQDTRHFQHQMQIILHNGGNCIGLIPAWLVMFLLATIAVNYRRIPFIAKERSFLIWVMMTVFVYCAGYMTVNLEARYIVPTVAPLLCLASLIMGRALLVIRTNDLELIARDHVDPALTIEFLSDVESSRSTAAVIGFVLLFSGVDLHNLYQIATVHPQSVQREKFRIIAQQLRDLKITDQPTACSDWHFGLSVAYAANSLPHYWGAPIVESDELIAGELESKNVRIFLRLVADSGGAEEPKSSKPFEGHILWTKSLVIRHRELLPVALEVYVRH